MIRVTLALTLALLASAAHVEAAPTLKKVVEKGKDADRGLDYEVSYLQLEGLADAAVQEKVNNSLRLMGQAGRRYMRILLRTWEKPAGWDQDSYLSVEVQAGVLTDQLLSVSQNVNSYFAGAAHPNTNLRTRTFDLRTGEVISRRLFKDGALPEVARRVDAKLRTMADYTMDGEYMLDAPEADDIKSVVVEKDGMTFLFSPYAIGAYAMGPVVVKLSFAELEGLLAESPALASVAQARSGPGVAGSLPTTLGD